MTGVKIATCCYCGSHAALTLAGTVRHQLACATCGAPLSRLKQMPVDAGGAPGRPHGAKRPAARARTTYPPVAHARGKPRKRKSFARWALKEAWDLVEDILD